MKKMAAKSGADGEKAQSGKKVYLRRGQLKRLGRLSAKNTDRAEKVGKRMVERATRVERGKEYVQKNVGALKPEVPSVGMRKGGKIKKARNGATLSPSNTSTSTNLASYKRTIGKNTSGKGGVKKCKYGC